MDHTFFNDFLDLHVAIQQWKTDKGPISKM